MFKTLGNIVSVLMAFVGVICMWASSITGLLVGIFASITAFNTGATTLSIAGVFLLNAIGFGVATFIVGAILFLLAVYIKGE